MLMLVILRFQASKNLIAQRVKLSKAACDKFPRISEPSLCEKSNEESSAKF